MRATFSNISGQEKSVLCRENIRRSQKGVTAEKKHEKISLESLSSDRGGTKLLSIWLKWSLQKNTFFMSWLAILLSTCCDWWA